MTDGLRKLRKAARRERWLRPAKRPTVEELLKKKGLAEKPGFLKKLKKRAKAVKNLLLESRKFDWDKYEPLLEKTYKSSRRISEETGLPFYLVVTARSLDFLEPTNPMFPIETRTATEEKYKKYGMPTTIAWASAPILLRDMVTSQWVEKEGWTEGGEKVS